MSKEIINIGLEYKKSFNPVQLNDYHYSIVLLMSYRKT